MNRAARRASRRRIGGLAGMSLVATTGLLGAYLGNPRMPRAYAAATCTVTTSADSGAGSLRQALLDHDAADANCSTINFASSVTTITLASNLPTVTGSSLTITGSGSLTVNLSGKSGIRMQNPAAGQTLSISGLTLTGGNASDRGGAVYGYKMNVVISDVTFTSNISSFGGAVAANYGSLDISNSTFTSNTSHNSAGAVSFTTTNGDPGTVNITGSTFTNNSAPGDYSSAGAVQVADNDLNVSSSTFTGNTTGSNGGAIFVTSGDVTLTNSTFTGTGAPMRVGAMAVQYVERNLSQRFLAPSPETQLVTRQERLEGQTLP